MVSEQPLLKVNNLKKYFPIHSGWFFQKEVASLKAVDDISFHINKGETLGLVGESGSGKSTTGKLILRLLESTSGQILYNGIDILSMPQSKFREFRKNMQIVFQDPYASLNPRMTVGEIIKEPLLLFKEAGQEKKASRAKDRVEELLNLVGLDFSVINRYPHEFSGGQRQRIGIARSLALNPAFIVADEPVSALDVSIQAQIINLFQDLKDRFTLTYLFIAHDLAVVRHISDRIAVMYLGKIVEEAPADILYAKPLHPYTKALLEAVPKPDPSLRGKRELLSGDPPSPVNPPSGCPFHPRCPLADNNCKVAIPIFEEKTPGHKAACIKVASEAAAK